MNAVNMNGYTALTAAITVGNMYVNTMHFKDLSYPQFFRVQECIGPSTSLT